jgi:hypothetical protein
MRKNVGKKEVGKREGRWTDEQKKREESNQTGIINKRVSARSKIYRL